MLDAKFGEILRNKPNPFDAEKALGKKMKNHANNAIEIGSINKIDNRQKRLFCPHLNLSANDLVIIGIAENGTFKSIEK